MCRCADGRRPRVIHHHRFHVAADQVIQRGRGAPVGDVGELHAGFAGEALP